MEINNTAPRSLYTQAQELTKPQEAGKKRSVIAATVGCLLEWYDFAVYAFFAVVIARLFFPAESEWVSLLLAVGTFGVGFAMRPVGALVLGTLADRKGRKVALTWTIAAMVLGTGIIAFAPTYATAGIAAPIFIVVARLIQGFSAGGEMGTATSFLIESAPANRRMLYASFSQLTQLVALILGSLVGAAVNYSLTTAQIDAGGWRIPFLIGLLIGPVGFYIRRNLQETPAFTAELAKRKSFTGSSDLEPSPWSVVRLYPRQALAGFCITVLWTVLSYFFLIHMPTYAVKQLHLPSGSSLISNSIALMVASILVPVFAIMADKFGARRQLIVAAVLILASAYPALLVLTRSPTLETLVLVQASLAILIAAFTAPAAGTLGELFPAGIRSTGISISYNFAVTLFGGFAPFITTWLIGWSGDPLAPAYYVAVAAVAAIGGASLLPRPDHAV